MEPEFRLEQEGQPVLMAPSQSDLSDALLQIDPKRRSYYTLSRNDGSYVQVAGARLRLTIEFRKVEPDSFQHLVLGRPAGDTTTTSINYSGGPIRLQKNEVLHIEDAIKIFHSFMNSGLVPPEYESRDVTALFKTE